MWFEESAEDGLLVAMVCLKNKRKGHDMSPSRFDFLHMNKILKPMKPFARFFFFNSWKYFVRTLRRQKKSGATFVVNLALLLRWKHAARFMAAQRRRPCVEGMWHHVNTQQARVASDSCLAQPTRAWGKAAAQREDKTGVSRPVMWCVIWRSHSPLNPPHPAPHAQHRARKSV